MGNPHVEIAEKVHSIWRELVGDRAERLSGSRNAVEAMKKVHASLEHEFSDEDAKAIAFHLCDWNSDAAFIMCLHLFPERFTDEEVSYGVTSFLVHAPNHVAAAAKVGGWPINDVFGLGVLDPDSDST